MPAVEENKVRSSNRYRWAAVAGRRSAACAAVYAKGSGKYSVPRVQNKVEVEEKRAVVVPYSRHRQLTIEINR